MSTGAPWADLRPESDYSEARDGGLLDLGAKNSATRAGTRSIRTCDALGDAAGGDDPEIGGQTHEIGHRVGLHFRQHAVAVDLGGPLGDPEIETDLLVELPADHVREHLPLARRQ